MTGHATTQQDRRTTASAPSANQPPPLQEQAPPDRFRWTRNGGRRLRRGESPALGDVVVSGKGHFSHHNATCEALFAGLAKSRREGHHLSRIYAVSPEIATRYVPPCAVCARRGPR